MEIAVLTLLSGFIVALYSIGRIFRERTPVSMAACLLIVSGSLVLVSGIGQTTNNSELTNLSTRTHDSLGNLVQTQNSTGNATSTNTWSATPAERNAIGIVYVVFGLYLLIQNILGFMEEAGTRRKGDF